MAIASIGLSMAFLQFSTSLAVTGFARRENNAPPRPGSFGGGAARSAWEASSMAVARGDAQGRGI
eukprot:714278-Prorocentrum_lima.AAC.1